MTRPPILIFRHVACEGPGYLCEYLCRHRIPYEIVCIREGCNSAAKTDLERASALVFMGAPGSVNDPERWILDELTLIEKAADRRIPILGVCFGAQLIAKALGGRVFPAGTLEVGWRTVRQNEGVELPPALAGLPGHFTAFQWHAHTFDPPPQATPLWRSQCVEQQGFVIDNILAMQFHLEVTADSIRQMAGQYASDLSAPGACVDDLQALVTDVDNRVRRLHQTANGFYRAWLELAGLAPPASG